MEKGLETAADLPSFLLVAGLVGVKLLDLVCQFVELGCEIVGCDPRLGHQGGLQKREDCRGTKGTFGEETTGSGSIVADDGRRIVSGELNHVVGSRKAHLGGFRSHWLGGLVEVDHVQAHFLEFTEAGVVRECLSEMGLQGTKWGLAFLGVGIVLQRLYAWRLSCTNSVGAKCPIGGKGRSGENDHRHKRQPDGLGKQQWAGLALAAPGFEEPVQTHEEVVVGRVHKAVGLWGGHIAGGWLGKSDSEGLSLVERNGDLGGWGGGPDWASEAGVECVLRNAWKLDRPQ